MSSSQCYRWCWIQTHPRGPQFLSFSAFPLSGNTDGKDASISRLQRLRWHWPPSARYITAQKSLASVFKFLNVFTSGPSNVLKSMWLNVVFFFIFPCSWWCVLAVDFSLFSTHLFYLVGPNQFHAPLLRTVGTGISLCPTVPFMLNQRTRRMMPCFCQIL